MTTNKYHGPPAIPAGATQDETVRWGRAFTRWAFGVMDGHTTNVGDVTLSASTVASVVSDVRVNINSAIAFVPTSANALADVVGTGVYASTVRNGTFTITHPSNANADKTFKYTLTG